MATDGIKINIALNARDVATGAKQSSDAIEDIQKSLDDLTKEAGRNKLGTDLGEDIQKGAHQGAQANEKLEASFKDIQEASKKTSSSVQSDSVKGGVGLSREFRKGAKEAGEGLGELKDSAKQNSIETAASFDGSANSIAAGFQSVASEALAGFGPVGLAAGLALSTGIGFFESALSNASTLTSALQQKVTDLTDDLISNKKYVASTSFLNDQIKAQIENTKDLTTAKKNANEIGITQQVSVRAEAGSQKDLALALKAAEKSYADNDRAAKALRGTDEAGEQQANARAIAASNLTEHYKKLILVNKDAVSQASFYATSTDKLTAAQKEQAKQAAATAAAEKSAGESQQSSIQSLVAANGTALASMLKSDKENNDESVASFSQGLQQKITLLNNETANEKLIYQKFGATAGAEIVKDVPADSPLFDRLAHATPAQAAQIEAQYAALAISGTAAAQAAANKNPVTVKVKGDFSDVASQINALRNTKVQIAVGTNTPLGAGVLRPRT